ncbi:hypothetical protein BDR26DRAFT_894406 [Obelidium mucronatum]|nr:hypothetical protein BDR26DRAFT_894406 [Obelidium mucronatum]
MKVGLVVLLAVAAAAVVAEQTSTPKSGSGVAVGVQEDFDVDFDAVAFDDDDVDDAADGLARRLEHGRAAAAAPTVLERGGRLLAAAAAWVDAHKRAVLAVLCALLAANGVFVAWVLGYLLREEHFVVRALRLPRSPPPRVFRVLADFAAYPLWRSRARSAAALPGGFTLDATSYTVTELKENESLVFRTHPEYEPKQYAMPLVMKGAPVPENINQVEKKKHEEKVAKLKEQGIDATSHIPKHRPKNILDLEVAPIFLPPGIPWSTQVWTIELEQTKDKKGSIVYVTYRGTYRSRIYRFLVSLVGFDRSVEGFLGDLAAFLGESSPTVKPHLGKLPDLD